MHDILRSLYMISGIVLFQTYVKYFIYIFLGPLSTVGVDVDFGGLHYVLAPKMTSYGFFF